MWDTGSFLEKMFICNNETSHGYGNYFSIKISIICGIDENELLNN